MFLQRAACGDEKRKDVLPGFIEIRFACSRFFRLTRDVQNIFF